MKPLLLIGAVVLLTSCTKNLTLSNPVSIDQFRSLIAGHQFHVSGTDDTFTFDTEQGRIESVEPCRVTYVPYRVYEQDGAVKIDWVNLDVQYETFVIAVVGEGGFTLKSDHHTITYTVIK